MKVPKIIEKNDHVYIFEKEYPNYFMYKDMSTGVKECFHTFDLIQVKNEKISKPTKWEELKG